MMRVFVFALVCSKVVANLVTTRRDTGETLSIKTRDELFTAYHIGDDKVDHPLYTDTMVSGYKSMDIKLMTGEAWFTLPHVTKLPMPEPGVPYAIVEMTFDIVEQSTGLPVPLSDMYSHHWLIYDKLVGSSGFDIGCGGEDAFVSNVFGAGGEMRGVRYNFPPGYGKVYAQNRHWSANMHFIRTEDLSTKHFNGSEGAALKNCIECDYVPGKAVECLPGFDGTAIFACCFDGSRCPVNNPRDKSKKTYNLVYNVTWTKEVDKVKDMRTFVIDAFDCEICENLAPHKSGRWTHCDDKMCVSQGTRTMPVSGTIAWGYTHQHTGAINSTLSINGVPHCTSYPHYGTDPHNTPGNEKGYAVGFHMCIDPLNATTHVHVNKGDNLTITAHVSVDPTDTRSLPIPGGEHHGFMHLFYFVLHPDSEEDAYSCKNDICVPQPGGVPLKTCQAACGGSAKLV